MGNMDKWISRQEEAALPTFKDHKEAFNYFKQKYKDRFQLTEVSDGIYFYILIHDQAAFEAGQEEMRTTGFTSGMDFMTSHQPIEINEDGFVHIIH